MSTRLQGARAAITGASAGIGAATAAELAARGCALVLGARRTERLEAMRSGILAAHPQAQVDLLPLDVTNPASCAAFAAAAGPIDVLVNSAGLARGTDKVAEGSEADWREMIETNVMGLLRVTRLLLPGMIERRRGTVINLGSVAGLEPYPGGAVYGATKSAVRTITKALRHELLGTGVRVCNVEPGAVHTEFSEVRFRGDEARAARVYQGFSPLTAEDVAEVIGFLASRPPHVDIEELVIYPTAQASTTAFHREG